MRDRDFFLHPGLSPEATAGRGVVDNTVNMINGFRKAGMKVLWTNVCYPFLTLNKALSLRKILMRNFVSVGHRCLGHPHATSVIFRWIFEQPFFHEYLYRRL
jgi:hypothetical protein